MSYDEQYLDSWDTLRKEDPDLYYALQKFLAEETSWAFKKCWDLNMDRKRYTIVLTSLRHAGEERTVYAVRSGPDFSISSNT